MKLSQRFNRFGLSYRFLALAVCLGIVLSLGATSAWAQAGQVGTVTGLVTDETHAAVPGAAIKIVELSTSAAYQTTTDSNGRYIFSSVTPGTYTLSIEKQGFNSYDVN